MNKNTPIKIVFYSFSSRNGLSFYCIAHKIKILIIVLKHSLADGHQTVNENIRCAQTKKDILMRQINCELEIFLVYFKV